MTLSKCAQTVQFLTRPGVAYASVCSSCSIFFSSAFLSRADELMLCLRIPLAHCRRHSRRYETAMATIVMHIEFTECGGCVASSRMGYLVINLVICILIRIGACTSFYKEVYLLKV